MKKKNYKDNYSEEGKKCIFKSLLLGSKLGGNKPQFEYVIRYIRETMMQRATP